MKIFNILTESKGPKIPMPELKYPHDGLEPTLSAETMKYHYGSHTKKYFDTVNELIKGTDFENIESLDALIAKGSKLDKKLYNNARQAHNHSFYWDCLTPADKIGTPSEQLSAEIKKEFGTVAKFKRQFIEEGVKGFGSTWTWLVWRDDKLVIETTPDANIPKGKLLLVVDFWEHAWYVDYPADKKNYAESVWHIINWNFVNQNFEKR